MLAAQVASHLNTDGADLTELAELVERFKPDDEESWHAFERASAASFRRFTETAMTLVEVETGDMESIERHEPSMRRIAEFLSGRITRHELYYVGSTWRLRRLAESTNARNDLTHVPINPHSLTEAQSVSA